jgi:hypothetical protein
VKIHGETLVKLEAHRKRQDEFRVKFGPDYRSDLDLIFCNPDGTPLKPDAISASVSPCSSAGKFRSRKAARCTC